ncbi:hypothetical protein ACFY2W_36275 [Streptomyces sp. NPDC001262]|uniref:hypothetical protein n=1 Tax=Streptomyces sp. NPDC001262 TaxID=3364552 RepID=UPI003675C1F8
MVFFPGVQITDRRIPITDLRSFLPNVVVIESGEEVPQVGKQKKGRRHRSVNRTPRPVGGQGDLREVHGHACFPHQMPPFQPVHRSKPELVDGRAYPATARMDVDGQLMKFDLIGNMYAVVHGEVTGPCADIMAAIALGHCEQHGQLLPSLGEEVPTTISELVGLFRRFFNEGLFGRDERGGYIDMNRVHAAHA